MSDKIEFNKVKKVYKGIPQEYTVYSIDGKKQDCKFRSLGLGKKIAEDIANLVVGRGIEFNFDDKNDVDELKELFDNNFKSFFTNNLEKMYGLGEMIIIPYFFEERILFDYFLAGTFEVNSWLNGRPTEVIVKYKVNEVDVVQVLTYDGATTYVEFKYDGKLDLQDYSFEAPIPYFKPNIADNKSIEVIDNNKCRGISVFANAIDQIESADITYSETVQEILLSRKMIIIAKETTQSATQTDEDGNLVNVQMYDMNNRIWQAVNVTDQQAEKLKDLFKEFSPEIRSEDLEKILNMQLTLISNTIGLGDRYSFAQGTVKTKNEIRSEDDEPFKTKLRHQIILNEELNNLVKAVQSLLGIDIDFRIGFDNEPPVDSANEFKRDMDSVMNGIMPRYQFAMKWYDLTEEEAKLWIIEANPTVQPIE